MIIAVTGHRPDKLGKEYDLQGPYTDFLVDKFYEIIEQYKPEKGISGMALGVDTIWAICLLSSEVPLLAAVPFEGQQVRWKNSCQDRYWEILRHPLTEIKYVCNPGYEVWKMQKRNEWMVDHADRLVAVWDGSDGGTGNCVRYAQSKRIPIEYIDPKEVKIN